MITEKSLIQKYGNPGDTKNLVLVDLPFPMRVAWDTKVIIKRFTCHKLVADKMKQIFSDILLAYGGDNIVKLGIDLFGGCYNYRQQRGGKSWSRHAWGVAIDLDPARNTLKETGKTARFARPEYKQMIDIFYKHGFVSLGREKNYDWMHFEVAE